MAQGTVGLVGQPETTLTTRSPSTSLESQSVRLITEQMFFCITLFLNDNLTGHLTFFITMNLFSAIRMFCNSPFEQGDLDLWGYVNAFIINIIIKCMSHDLLNHDLH